ncbi:MAG: Holo-(acyl-carrier-protein) synthase [Firmicutes bacterium ADurb.Bin182]|nr:MAG: Holo-(acyl-carrier-protein) synthase [Firmicutes bacterium ADurb.Bin182]
MVVGTGIDIIEVDRVSDAAERQSFFERVFTPQERAYFVKQNHNPQTIAGTFAAKEATAKALSAGFNGIKWQDIEILRDESGKPYVKLWNAAEKRMHDLGGKSIHISISHIKALAVAQAILED